MFTVVYAANESLQREPLWEDTVRISTAVQFPWLVAGNFNTMLVYGEKLIDGETVGFENSELLQCTFTCNPQDMREIHRPSSHMV